MKLHLTILVSIVSISALAFTFVDGPYRGSWDMYEAYLRCDRTPGSVIPARTSADEKWLSAKWLLRPSFAVKKPLTSYDNMIVQLQDNCYSTLDMIRARLLLATCECRTRKLTLSTIETICATETTFMKSRLWRQLRERDSRKHEEAKKAIFSKIEKLCVLADSVFGPISADINREFSRWAATHPDSAKTLVLRRKLKELQGTVDVAISMAGQAEQDAAFAREEAARARNAAMNAEAAAADANARANAANRRAADAEFNLNNRW